MHDTFLLPHPSYQHLVAGTVELSFHLTWFEYEEAFGMSEDVVTSVVACFLRAQGYEVLVAPKGAAGADIVAQSACDRMIVEVKGEGSDAAAICRSFQTALGQIVQRMQREDARYVVVFPAQRGFVRRALALQRSLRERLSLEVWAVVPDNMGYMLTILPPNVS